MNLKAHEIGCYTHNHPGPLLLVTAGIHGNEPAGVTALKNVIEQLEKEEAPIQGSFVGLLANVPAFEKGVRYIDEDMNRIWTESKLEVIEKNKKKLGVEEQQVSELMEVIQNFENDFDTQRIHIDLHTTSSESIPYISVNHTSVCQQFALEFPMQCVVGFGGLIDGTIDKWFCKNGIKGFTVEAGQHFRSSSVENCEALLWMALVRSGCLDSEYAQRFKASRAVLGKFIFDKKKNFKIIYRCSISPGSAFKMEPNFVNFERIYKGELLAHLDDKPIHSEWDARILMPLYQAQGEDGFFIIQET